MSAVVSVVGWTASAVAWTIARTVPVRDAVGRGTVPWRVPCTMLLGGASVTNSSSRARLRNSDRTPLLTERRAVTGVPWRATRSTCHPAAVTVRSAPPPACPSSAGPSAAATCTCRRSASATSRPGVHLALPTLRAPARQARAARGRLVQGLTLGLPARVLVRRTWRAGPVGLALLLDLAHPLVDDALDLARVGRRDDDGDARRRVGTVRFDPVLRQR